MFVGRGFSRDKMPARSAIRSRCCSREFPYLARDLVSHRKFLPEAEAEAAKQKDFLVCPALTHGENTKTQNSHYLESVTR
jgi:hypothetical protein